MHLARAALTLDQENPFLRSFDPCMPCTTHMDTGNGVLVREVNSRGCTLEYSRGPPLGSSRQPHQRPRRPRSAPSCEADETLLTARREARSCLTGCVCLGNFTVLGLATRGGPGSVLIWPMGPVMLHYLLVSRYSKS